MARREHSRAELKRKLEVCGFEIPIIEDIVELLEKQGWQSDERFAEAYTRSRIAKGFGPVRIQQELHDHGIDHAPIDKFMLQIASGWDELMENVYAKKYRGQQADSPVALTKRRIFLKQRGFKVEQIYSFLDDTIENND